MFVNTTTTHTHSTILFIFSIYHFPKEMKEKRLMGMNCQKGIKGKWVHIPLFDLSSFQTYIVIQ